MDVQDILVYVIVLFCVWRIWRHFHRTLTCRHNGCCESAGCAGCPLSEQCGHHHGEKKK